MKTSKKPTKKRTAPGRCAGGAGSASSEIAKEFCTYTPQQQCSEEYLAQLILPLEQKAADLWEICVALKKHAEEAQKMHGIHAEALIEEAEEVLRRVNLPNVWLDSEP